MRNIPGLAALACMGLLASGAAQAITVNFAGTLVTAPDCELNTGKDIDVNFQEVVSNKIDGVNYKKMPIPYTVSCSGGSPGSGQLKVMLEFDTVPWGDFNSLQAGPTPKFNNFGLRITQGNGDTTYVPKTKLVIADSNNPTKLYAVPIRNPSGAGLPEGSFNATATMTAMYE